jgi:hypothetical protein
MNDSKVKKLILKRERIVPLAPDELSDVYSGQQRPMPRPGPRTTGGWGCMTVNISMFLNCPSWVGLCPGGGGGGGNNPAPQPPPRPSPGQDTSATGCTVIGCPR